MASIIIKEYAMYGVPDVTDWSFLKDQTLEQLCVGQFQFQMIFSGGVIISVEANFIVSEEVTPATEDETYALRAAKLATSIGQNVSSVVRESSHRLSIIFSDSTILHLLDSNFDHESFQIHWNNGSIIV
jgi:hypothetical protein